MKQSESEILFQQWIQKGAFLLNGSVFKRGVNDRSAIKAMIPDDKKMTGLICHLPSELTLTNTDLDDTYHYGFTIGKGKAMYWYLVWHKSGNCTVYSQKNVSARYIKGDTIITVHFK